MLPRNQTVSVSSLTITAWWPMPVCSCRPPSPGIWACGNSVDHHLDLGGAPGRANTGDKASAMAGGDCIDVLRTGGTACTLGGTVKAPSTLGTFLRSTVVDIYEH